MASSDIAVVGAGIVGLSAAVHLAERRVGSVVVYEKERVGAGASGIQPGGVRQQWGTRVNCVMARESLGFYREIDERLSTPEPLVFRPCGYLFAAQTERVLERLEDNVRLQRELGIPSRILAPSEAAEIAPRLDPDALLGAAFCAEDGYFDKPQAVVAAFAEAAVRLGVRIVHAEVTGLEPDGSGWSLRLADGEAALAAHAVVAAGCGTAKLVDLPIRAEPRYLFFSEPIHERLLDPLVVVPERRFAAKQLADGRLLASDLGAEGDPAAESERWRSHIRRTFAGLLPSLAQIPLPTLAGGEYDSTPDRQAALGAVPGHDDLWVAAGFSGHGFMIAPAAGEAIATIVSGGDSPFPELAPDRFRLRRLVPEPQII